MKQHMLFFTISSMVLGILAGIFFPKQTLSFSWIGLIFINMLKLIVLPLIFCALVSAITNIGGTKQLGRIGIYTIAYVLFSVSIAVIIGLTLINAFKPGVGVSPHLIIDHAATMDFKPMELSSFLLTLFPPNIIAAAARYEIMPLVFFSLVFAIACVSVGELAAPVIVFFNGLRAVLIKMIMWLMALTPIGLFSLLGTAVAEAKVQHLLLKSLSSIVIFIAIFIAGLVLQVAWQIVVVSWIARTDLRQFLKSASKAMLTAFITSSSMATLPVTMVVAKEQRISDEVSRFVLPLATTINLAGTAMYEAVSALFFCQILNFNLSIPEQIGVFITAILAGMGATGIPEGGLVTMVMVLRNVNVPSNAIGLLLPFDRILDRLRTMTNVWGDLVCAITVDKLQQRYYKQHPPENSNH